jgi:hypothetical protein
MSEEAAIMFSSAQYVLLRSTRCSRMLALLAVGVTLALPAYAELSPEELAKLAQNPIGNVVSIPFQNNTNFGVEPQGGTQDILNIQPVYPFEVSKDWNVIARTIMPLIWQTGMTSGEGTTFGLGDVQIAASMSPAAPLRGGWIWGAGAIAQLPTDTERLGNKNWGAGADGRVVANREEQPLGLWSIGQQRLVAFQRRARWLLQQSPAAAFHLLQLSGRHLPRVGAADHRQLESRQRPPMDSAAGIRCRTHLPPGQAAVEHADQRLLQHRSLGLRREVETAGADTGHVPEVNRAMITVPDPLHCLARDEEQPTNEFGFLFAGVREQT